MTDDNRRQFLKATGLAAALGAATGTASAHDLSSDTNDSTDDSAHDHTDASLHGATSDVELLDYHSLGDVGPSSESGSPDSPHYGGITEIRVRDDYAYAGFFSSDNPTGDRGMAVLDVSEFNAADSTDELRDAELDVVSFLRNDNAAAAVMDVKVSDDGEYAFISKQPYTALFEETDPKPDDDGDSISASASALQAVDVSDPASPEIVGTYDVWDTGPHNAFYHRIDDTDYVFAIKDNDDGTAALYVFEFERATGVLVLVNKWTKDGDIADGNVVGGGLTYIHDVTIRDDPELDRPVGYLSYWDAGLYALDLSDPTDISVLGHFDMARAHYAEPAPELVDGKRVVVAGQETPSQTDGSTGKLKLLDADGLGTDWSGEDNVAELDSWEWQSNATFDDFLLSPHNFDVTGDGWVHAGHYHGGTRFLRIHTDDWTLEEKGYFQAAKDVPEDSKMEGLNHASPFTWAAVSQEGVVYAADINTGIYALRYKPDSDSSASSLGWAAGGLALAGLANRYGDRARELLGGSG
ncbi:LVIVD repeat-containing protein [Halorussus salinisoli]|uniref:LVIVD repeat-containing protein n=1 Tax=Halorussus salinisoli TaxID=2558242 RepID=UPI0010C187B8|nr:hypothetical protein [Halorussus salinisoli]